MSYPNCLTFNIFLDHNCMTLNLFCENHNHITCNIFSGVTERAGSGIQHEAGGNQLPGTEDPGKHRSALPGLRVCREGRQVCQHHRGPHVQKPRGAAIPQHVQLLPRHQQPDVLRHRICLQLPGHHNRRSEHLRIHQRSRGYCASSSETTTNRTAEWFGGHNILVSASDQWAYLRQPGTDKGFQWITEQPHVPSARHKQHVRKVVKWARHFPERNRRVLNKYRSSLWPHIEAQLDQSLSTKVSDQKAERWSITASLASLESWRANLPSQAE